MNKGIEHIYEIYTSRRCKDDFPPYCDRHGEGGREEGAEEKRETDEE